MLKLVLRSAYIFFRIVCSANMAPCHDVRIEPSGSSWEITTKIRASTRNQYWSSNETNVRWLVPYTCRILGFWIRLPTALLSYRADWYFTLWVAVCNINLNKKLQLFFYIDLNFLRFLRNGYSFFWLKNPKNHLIGLNFLKLKFWFWTEFFLQPITLCDLWSTD